MHIRNMTQSRPMRAQLEVEAPFMTALGKIQAVAATIIAIRDAVDAFRKAE